MADLAEYLEIIQDRPEKFDAEDVEYGPAPEGSAMRCASCQHLFTRRIDGFNVCEIFRDDESDSKGVFPDWRCRFWTVDGQVFPLLEEPPSTEHEEVPTDEDDIPF
jgi:hypothetical protein